MGINSYITHRMFVAALSHEEAGTSRQVPGQNTQKQAHESNLTNPWEAQLLALAEAKAVARVWRKAGATGA